MVDASVLGPRHLLVKCAHEALFISECTETFLAVDDSLGVVIPRIRGVANALPIVASWHLVGLGHTLSMVELLAEAHHA